MVRSVSHQIIRSTLCQEILPRVYVILIASFLSFVLQHQNVGKGTMSTNRAGKIPALLSLVKTGEKYFLPFLWSW